VLRRTGVVGVLALAAFACLTAEVADARRAAPAPAQWLAYGHDAQLTNFVELPGFDPAAARHLRVAWQQTLDGSVVASPLYAGNSVFAATEAGSVYALRADDGSVRWKRAFGEEQTPGCGPWGISSTGAIDEKLGVLYVTSPDGYLHALSLSDGSERPGWPVAVTAAHPDGEYVWGGLRLLGRTLYVPVASYCDSPGSDGHVANGRLVAVDVDRHALTATFDPVPGDGNLGGIWGWGGVSADPDGKTLFTGVGNSYSYDDGCSCYIDTAGYGDAMVSLTPDLRVKGWNRPPHYLMTGDYDFGSAPLLFQPSGCPPLAAANSKLGVLYVWDRDHLARGPVFHLALSDGLQAFVGQPSYSPRLRTIFDSHAVVIRDGKRVGDGIAALSVGPRCGFHRRWLTSVGEGEEPPPLVAGDVVLAAGGTAGGLTALDARTGKYLWRVKPDSANALSPVIAAGTLIVDGDSDDIVRAFTYTLPHARFAPSRVRGEARRLHR
jgi:hypothetical protein